MATIVLDDARERELIRTRLDDTIVVEAAAGTGKTTELVARLVRLLASGRTTVDSVAAVTFTEKAAGELKLRVRAEVEKARDDAPLREQQLLGEALAHLEEAHISTIHGFCAELLRERPVEARVDPEFVVLTETQADRIFDEAFRLWMQRQLQAPGEGVRRCLRRPEPPWRDDADSNGPIGRLRAAGRELREWRDFDRPWRREPFDRDAEIQRCMTLVRDVAASSARSSWSGDAMYKATAAVRRLAAEYDRAIEDGVDDPDGWEAGLVALTRDRDFIELRKRPGTRAIYGDGVSRATLVQACDALAERLAAFHRAADADLAALLQHDLQECLAKYDELKRRAGALDFLDLLLKARALVRDHREARSAFQSRIRYIFVDEFQDTDPLQAEILLLLAGDESSGTVPGESDEGSVPDWREVPIRPGALFVVGDPKQSIYRFRRADVGTYHEVCDRLVRTQGAIGLTLRTSFRSVPNIQLMVNAAFSRVMTGDRQTLQASYVPLARSREPLMTTAGRARQVQPSVVALPVPRPYGRRNVAAYAVEESLPDAVGGFVEWLVHHSGWSVVEHVNGAERVRPVGPRHICVLFRRFVSWQEDVTRKYVEALEARGVPHLLVGGRAFHEREEVETLRAALAAVEWPEDQLSVYATLRGSLFALGEESLLEYWHRHPRRRFHPFDVPADVPDTLAPVRDALNVLRELHVRRNHRPVAETISELLRVARAHVTFVLRPAGEQALANVMYVTELARQYEADGGISFRGFVDELQSAADRFESPDAPVLEEGSEGVRLMTVHKAKGLEFPVVILADPTCKLHRSTASRALDPDSHTCGIRLAGCAPVELLERQNIEVAREAAEGVRLAYVAATRARDLLVVPVVGDQEIEGWLNPLNPAVYPPVHRRRHATAAPGTPVFKGDSVLERPNGDPAGEWTVAPGLHTFDGAEEEKGVGRVPGEGHEVVWWDPLALNLGVAPAGGLRRAELIAKEQSEALDAEGLARYHAWQRDRTEAIVSGSVPSLRVRTITEWAQSGDPWPLPEMMPLVTFEQVDRVRPRPAGARFGSLVHAVLAVSPLEATAQTILPIARVQGRLLAATDEEVTAAADLAVQVLDHPIVQRAREARRACRREVPVTITIAGTLLEGVVDLVFPEDGEWTLVDFKTDGRDARDPEAYRRQLAMYAAAVGRATGARVRATLLSI
jgi:ATP-dependent helicase/nuclease subunit A